MKQDRENLSLEGNQILQLELHNVRPNLRVTLRLSSDASAPPRPPRPFRFPPEPRKICGRPRKPLRPRGGEEEEDGARSVSKSQIGWFDFETAKPFQGRVDGFIIMHRRQRRRRASAAGVLHLVHLAKRLTGPLK